MPAKRECDVPGALAGAEVEPFVTEHQETRRRELLMFADELAGAALPSAPDEAVLEFAARLARRTHGISAK
ncbi:MAG: hypothetical protein Q8N26_35385 [Myxococcales bacterium]|nr:hypothetical protein [Myxococcales bacterium]